MSGSGVAIEPGFDMTFTDVRARALREEIAGIYLKSNRDAKKLFRELWVLDAALRRGLGEPGPKEAA